MIVSGLGRGKRETVCDVLENYLKKKAVTDLGGEERKEEERRERENINTQILQSCDLKTLSVSLTSSSGIKESAGNVGRIYCSLQ